MAPLSVRPLASPKTGPRRVSTSALVRRPPPMTSGFPAHAQRGEREMVKGDYEGVRIFLSLFGLSFFPPAQRDQKRQAHDPVAKPQASGARHPDPLS